MEAKKEWGGMMGIAGLLYSIRFPSTRTAASRHDDPEFSFYTLLFVPALVRGFMFPPIVFVKTSLRFPDRVL